MENKRKVVRINSGDFVNIQALNEPGKIHSGKTKDFSLMGVCFTSDSEWKTGQVLLIDYFLPSQLDSVKVKIVVVWSEFIDPENGYFCGGKIIEVEEVKQDKFANYYFQKLQERFFERE